MCFPSPRFLGGSDNVGPFAHLAKQERADAIDEVREQHVGHQHADQDFAELEDKGEKEDIVLIIIIYPGEKFS